MSSYLSPILSSGDSTPTRSESGGSGSGAGEDWAANKGNQAPFSKGSHSKAPLVNKSLASMLAAAAANEEDEEDSCDEDEFGVGFDCEQRRKLRGSEEEHLSNNAHSQHCVNNSRRSNKSHLSTNLTSQLLYSGGKSSKQQQAEDCREQESGKDQLQQLFQSAASNQERVNKKLRQILQSIPTVPLIATTSIMAVLIICFLLILSNLSSSQLKFATATLQQNSQQQEAANRESAQENRGQFPLAESAQAQALIMNGNSDKNDHEHEEESQQAGSVSAMARRLAMKRELLDGLFEGPEAQVRRARQQRRPPTIKRHSGAAEVSAGPDQQAAAIESALGAILLGADPKPLGGDERAEEPVDVESSLSAQLLGHSAHRPPAARHRQQHEQLHQRQHQQQHYEPHNHNSKQQQQQQQYHASNHERPFDVAQIRKYFHRFLQSRAT